MYLHSKTNLLVSVQKFLKITENSTKNARWRLYSHVFSSTEMFHQRNRNLEALYPKEIAENQEIGDDEYINAI